MLIDSQRKVFNPTNKLAWLTCFLLLGSLLFSIAEMSTLSAQETASDEIFKAADSKQTNIQITPFDVNVELSVKNPRDRDADKLGLSEMSFEPFNRVLLKKYRNNDAEFWLKIHKVGNSEFTNSDLISFNPKNIKKIELVIPELNNALPLQSSGQFQIDQQSKYSKRAIVFELPEQLTAANYVYFHVWANSDATVNLEAWSADDYVRIDKKHSSFLTMIFASLISLILVNLIFFVGIRDKNYLYYSLFLLAAVIVLMTNTNKIYEFGIAKLLANSQNIILCMVALMGFLLCNFIQKFLRLKDYHEGFHKLCDVISIIFIILGIVSLVARPLPEFIPPIISLFAWITSPLLFIIPALTLQMGNRQSRYILYALIPIILALLVKLLLILGVVPNSLLTLYAIPVSMVLQALIMSIGLSDQVMDLRKQRDQFEHKNRKHNLSLEIEKKHSDLLARVKLHIKPDAIDPEKEVVKGFFEELRPIYRFHKAAIIYQIDTEMHIRVDREKHLNPFEDYVHTNQLEIPRICHGTEITELSIGDKTYFDKNTKIVVVPVFMRGQEWSGMLINVDKSTYYNSIETDSLHRYATEMIRSMLSVHIADSIRAEARQDPITHKLNRAAISEELDNAIKNRQYTEQPLSVALIDINDFTAVNDSYGKEIGDLCLQYVASKISQSVAENTSIGRMGGDDFLLVMEDCSTEQAEDILRNLSTQIEFISINNIKIEISVSIGITLVHGPFETVRDIMKRTDKGLKQAKDSGETFVIVEI